MENRLGKKFMSIIRRDNSVGPGNDGFSGHSNQRVYFKKRYSFQDPEEDQFSSQVGLFEPPVTIKHNFHLQSFGKPCQSNTPLYVMSPNENTNVDSDGQESRFKPLTVEGLNLSLDFNVTAKLVPSEDMKDTGDVIQNNKHFARNSFLNNDEGKELDKRSSMNSFDNKIFLDDNVMSGKTLKRRDLDSDKEMKIGDVQNQTKIANILEEEDFANVTGRKITASSSFKSVKSGNEIDSDSFQRSDKEGKSSPNFLQRCLRHLSKKMIVNPPRNDFKDAEMDNLLHKSL